MSNEKIYISNERRRSIISDNDGFQKSINEDEQAMLK